MTDADGSAWGGNGAGASPGGNGGGSSPGGNGRDVPACEDVRMHLGGYVLGGLEPRETRRVDEHLGVCGSCAAETADLAAVPGLLTLIEGAPPEPPVDVRRRVLDDVGRPRPAPRRAVGLVAALLAAAVVSGAALLAAPGNDEEVGAPAEQVSVRTELRAGEGTDARGVLTLSPSGSGLLVQIEAADLEPPPPRGVYEAWLRKPDREEPVSIGRFQPDQAGTAAVTFTVAGDLDDYDGFWVTAEPDDTDPAHQGPTVLWADVP